MANQFNLGPLNTDKSPPLYDQNPADGPDGRHFVTPSTVEMESLFTAMRKSRKAVVNVGGVRHEIIWTALERHPKTRLGRLRQVASIEDIFELCDDVRLIVGHDTGRGDEVIFYFDRSAKSFESVLNFYRTGKLHVADESCALSSSEDLEYWGIGEECIGECCQHRYYYHKETSIEEIRKRAARRQAENAVENFGTGSCSTARRRVWEMLEKPRSSIAGLVLAIVSIVFILSSLTVLTLESLPELKSPRLLVSVPEDQVTMDYNISGFYITQEDSIHRTFVVVKMIYVVWFTLEIALRLWASPNKIGFFKDVLNVLDLCVVLSSYVRFIFVGSRSSSHGLGFIIIIEFIFVFLLCIRFLRIFKILSLMCLSNEFELVSETLKRSLKQFIPWSILFFGGVFLFSACVFVADAADQRYHFESLADGFWWAIITLTGVGYGDFLPQTHWGRIIGSVCSLYGILMKSLAFAIVVNTFSECFTRRKRQEKVFFKNKESIATAQQTRTADAAVAI